MRRTWCPATPPPSFLTLGALHRAGLLLSGRGTLPHVHCWAVRMPRAAAKDEVLAALRTSTRIALLRSSDGLGAINVVKEMMSDLGRRRADIYEVCLWEDLLTVSGDELFFTYMVDNQAIVIPETIDAIRALAATQPDARTSIAATDLSLGIPLGRARSAAAVTARTQAS